MSLHVLVISDNEPFAAYLLDLLRAAGHTASWIAEGKNAYRAIRQEKPHLIIVSVEPAKIPGLAVEQRIHTQEGTRKIPVIVISECLRFEAELLHIFDFIPKPLDVNRLMDDIAAIARRPAKTESAAPMSDKRYREFSGHILSRTGLHFEARNRAALERGVDKRMSALGLESCSEYLAYLKRHGEDRHELQKLLQFLTVGETYFFRYPSHFAALRERLAAQYAFSTAPIRIWSAGCSTGEEPYSIAISIMEALPDWKERDIKVIATDINNRSLKRAREGVYSPWSMRIAEQHYRQRYFDRVGDSFIIRDKVKGLVEFSHLNLSSPGAAAVRGELEELDAVFCRNVLIYFSQEAAARMVDGFAEALKTGGQLFLGHAETLIHNCPTLEIRRQQNSFYYLKSKASSHRGRGREEKPSLTDAGARLTLTPPPSPQIEEQEQKPQLSQQGPPNPSPFPPRSGGAAEPSAEADSAAARLEAARQLFDAEDFEGAEKLLETLADCPEETAALILRGFILAGKGHFQEALDACSRAIELNDLLPEAYFLKGTILDANDQLPEAAEEYRKALLLDHDFIMPRFHMGRLHLRLGRVPEAAREIRNSLRILSKRGDEETIPYSGGLTRAVCMVQLQNALAQVA